MGSIRRAYLDSEHGQVHYHHVTPPQTEATGTENLLPVLLLHMSASSSKSMVALAQLLAASGYHCFAPDMPAFGESFDPASDPPSIQWYADLYHEIFSEIPEFMNGCHVIGHHSGAVVGTELAASNPGFVKTLTLVGPTVMSKAERIAMRNQFMVPFNQPVSSGDHLLKTWEYLIWLGIPRENTELLQREAVDHIRAWKGRCQIYACVWDYDCEAGMRRVDKSCKMLALCARDDVLWPYFENVKALGLDVDMREIHRANFGPDLDASGIIEAFIDTR